MINVRKWFYTYNEQLSVCSLLKNIEKTMQTCFYNANYQTFGYTCLEQMQRQSVNLVYVLMTFDKWIHYG